MFLIREDDLSGEDVRALLALHLEGMQASSPPENVFALDLSGLQVPEITLWSAWQGSNLAALGALKMLPDGNGEVKSMRTHPDFIRRGAANAILNTIIASAKAKGARRLSLETGRGESFEPALALYRRQGFKDGAPFSHYEPNPFSQFLHLELT
ncbi:GNAT family N-acetyltransferase [Erwinia oleae]|uniref:GNAT family N-acetyltransferase n=1 Tax=Erwinia oleae TaxID=796334 RepID=UPI00055962F9|nr:GNAT family N-acetyltransferase [Erwinia oleae]